MRRLIIAALTLLPLGFAASADAYELRGGDLVALSTDLDLTGFGLLSTIHAVQSDGTVTSSGLRATRSIAVTGQGLIRTLAGDLLDSSFRRVGRTTAFPGGLHMVLDETGDVVVFSSSYFDLAADQCTIAWLSATELRISNRCTGTDHALATLAGAPRDVDFAPDGTILVNTVQKLTRYRADGTIVATVSDFGLRGRLAFSPDARTAVIATPGLLFTYDLETNTLSRWQFVRLGTVSAMAVYGGWTAARGFADYPAADVPLDRRALAALIATLALLAFRRCAA